MIITVIGSTGTIGSELVRLLSQASAPARALFRDLKKVQLLPGVAWTQADLRDRRALEAAIAGTTRLFLLTDNQPGFADLQIQILRIAESLGVAHVVKLSALGASDHSKSWIAREHHEVENALQRSSMQWTILRPHAFMQNWLGEVAESVRSRGIIESPIGDGRVPFIDTRDIAAVAAEVLLHPEEHASRKYVLTGGEAVGFEDVARVLTDMTGRKVAYHPIAMDDARARLESSGLHRDQIDGMLAISAYQKAGGPTSIISDTVSRILGRPPRTIREFLADHAGAFLPASSA
jgi:uncharacterized protein YbjT (DUF2867 family)